MASIINLQRETISEHIRAEIAKEWDAVYNTFVQGQNAFYDVVPLGTRFGGIEGVQDFYSIIHAAFPDFTILVTGEYDTPGCSIREVTIAGTHLGEYGGIPPSGNPIALEIACFFIFDTKANAGKLLAERVYFDNESLLRQCRGETNLPTKIGLVDIYSRNNPS
ncbi:MAG: ester cyclase [Chitinophagaceae bacterium]